MYKSVSSHFLTPELATMTRLIVSAGLRSGEEVGGRRREAESVYTKKLELLIKFL